MLEEITERFALFGHPGRSNSACSSPSNLLSPFYIHCIDDHPPIMAPLTRETIIPILGSMRITIPADTNMSDTLLEKRLEKALDIAQFAAAILPTLKGDLTPWPEKKSVKQDITRFCTTDPMEANQAIMDGSYDDPTGGRAAFASIRWILVELSEALDQEMKGVILHDKEQKSAVLVMVRNLLCHLRALTKPNPTRSKR